MEKEIIKKYEFVEEEIETNTVGNVKISNPRIEAKYTWSGNGYSIYYPNRSERDCFMIVEGFFDVEIKGKKQKCKVRRFVRPGGNIIAIEVEVKNRSGALKVFGETHKLIEKMYQEIYEIIESKKKEAKQIEQEYDESIKKNEKLIFVLRYHNEMKCDDSQTVFELLPKRYEKQFSEEIYRVQKIAEFSNVKLTQEFWRVDHPENSEIDIAGKKFKVGDEIEYNELLELLDIERVEKQIESQKEDERKRREEFENEVEKVEKIDKNKYKYEGDIYEIVEGSFDNSFGEADEPEMIPYRRLYKNGESVKHIPDVVFTKKARTN